MTDLPFEQWHPDAQRQCGFWWDLSPIACGQCERCRKEQRGHPNGGWMRSTDIDAARAATEARHQQDRMRWASNLKDQHASHQQEITAKDETIGRWTQTGLTLMKFFAAVPAMNESDMPEFLWREVPTLIRSTRQAAAKAEARLAAVEAERDKQAEQIADLTMHKASRDSQLGCLLEDIGGKKYPTMNEARDQIAAWKAMTAERDRLKAALSQAAQDLETVGNDYPGSSCWQWCAERAGVARAALSGEGTAKP